MRNFGMMVKMMVMAVLLCALFCSCNVAGGSDYSSPSAARESSVSTTDVDGPAMAVTFGIKLPSVDVSISGDDMVKQDATATFTADATEGASLAWYLNGMETGETGSVYQFSCAYPGMYDVTCIAVSADGKMAKSASRCITVLP